jgi:hypothetical protein
MQVRPMRAVRGVKTIGADVDFIYGTVELVVPNGTFQSVVKLSREVLERRDLSCHKLERGGVILSALHVRGGTSAFSYAAWYTFNGCDVMGLYSGAFISSHLLRQSPGCISAVSGGDLHQQAVARAMQMLRGYTAQGRTSSARSGLVEGTMVWTVAMPAENSAELVEELSSHVASEADWQRMAVV